MSFAQCQLGADWQKYTGLMVHPCAADCFHVLFAPAAKCTCKSHKVQLQGYDSSGLARTAVAQEYNTELSRHLSVAIHEACSQARPVCVQEGIGRGGRCEAQKGPKTIE